MMPEGNERNGNEGWWSLVPPSETESPPILGILSMPEIYPTGEHTKGSGDTLPLGRSASAGQETNGGDGVGRWLGDFLIAMTCCQAQRLGGDEADPVVKTSVHIPTQERCARTGSGASRGMVKAYVHKEEEMPAVTRMHSGSAAQDYQDKNTEGKHEAAEGDWISGMVGGTRELADLKKISDKNDSDVEKTHAKLLAIEAKMKELARKGRTIEYERLKKELRILQDKYEDCTFKQKKLLARYEKASMEELASKGRDDLGRIDDYYQTKSVSLIAPPRRTASGGGGGEWGVPEGGGGGGGRGRGHRSGSSTERMRGGGYERTSSNSASLERIPSGGSGGRSLPRSSSFGRTLSADSKGNLHARSQERSGGTSSELRRTYSAGAGRSMASRENSAGDEGGRGGDGLSGWLAQAAKHSNSTGTSTGSAARVVPLSAKNVENFVRSSSGGGGGRNRVLKAPDEA